MKGKSLTTFMSLCCKILEICSPHVSKATLKTFKTNIQRLSLITAILHVCLSTAQTAKGRVAKTICNKELSLPNYAESYEVLTVP